MQLNKDVTNKIVEQANKHLQLKNHGFALLSQSSENENTQGPYVVYSSNNCKLKIYFREWDPPFQNVIFSIDIKYGRLSAPDEKNTIFINSVEHYCWHQVAPMLHFLDNSPPEYAASKLISHNVISEFRKTPLAMELTGSSIEWELVKHSYIWDKYAPRLFELLNINNNDEWEKYRLYLKKISDTRNNLIISPPIHNIS